MASKIDIWMPVFIGDFHKETAEFTAEMTGAYILLCLYHWFKGPPKDDDEVLARICKLSAERLQKIKEDLLFSFENVDGRWVNQKQLAEFKKWKKTRESRSNSARIAANAKHSKAKKGIQPDPPGLPDDAYQ
jgi:uncharacterized protein YdaU (DUF1376 family)